MTTVQVPLTAHGREPVFVCTRKGRRDALASIYPDGESKRTRLEKLRSSLESTRSSFVSQWRELSDYIAPRRVRFWASDKDRGDKRHQFIINSTAEHASEILASGMHAGLTNPSRPWMKLSTPDPSLAESPGVKEWLHITTTRMLTVFSQANLYNALPELYGDMGVFSMGAMSVLEDYRDLFRCYVYPIGSYAVAVDARGLVNTFAYEYTRTTRQIVEEFGVIPGTTRIDWTRISHTVKECWDHGNYSDPHTCVWMVTPNESPKPNALYAADRMPFYSCHYEHSTRESDGDKDKFLKESGFRQFPIMVPRWRVTGDDAYGTNGPGMKALGDVKQLQTMERRSAQLLQKAVDPPMVAGPQLRTQKTSILAGDLTYDEAVNRGHGFRPAHEVRLEGYQYVEQKIARVEQRVNQSFYADLFLMIAFSDQQLGAQRPTAREIEERHEEKLMALGPVLERTNDELLTPMVDRVFDMMLRAGLIPDAPPELEGVDLKVEFTSILAQAQKLAGVAQIDRFMAGVMGLAQVWPESRHKVNVDQAIENYGEDIGVDPRLVRSTEEAAQLAQAEQQAAQQAQDAENAQKLSSAVATAGAKPVAPDSPLDRLAGALRG